MCPVCWDSITRRFYFVYLQVKNPSTTPRCRTEAAPHFLNIETRCSYVISFTLPLLCPHRNSLNPYSLRIRLGGRQRKSRSGGKYIYISHNYVVVRWLVIRIDTTSLHVVYLSVFLDAYRMATSDGPV
jgi:hypothetical protein